MDTNEGHEREVRAARNQAFFRALNEKIREVNLAFSAVPENYVIACECADATCVEMLEIPSDEYAWVRSNPRRFAVLEGHVYRDIERAVAAKNTYVVVEKLAAAGDVADALSADDASIAEATDRAASA